MAITLSEMDKERVRFSLGYLNVEPSAAISLGFPSAGQAEFLVERAMNRLIPATVGRIQSILNILDSIESQMVEALRRLKAIKIDEITLRNSTEDSTEQDLLEREYRRWAQRLADNLGVPLNVYSERFRSVGMGYNHSVNNGI